MKTMLRSLLTASLLVAALVADVDAQTRSGLGAGYAAPYGDWSSLYGGGFTIRGRAAMPVTPLASLHLQSGWTRFFAEDGLTEAIDDADIYHIAVGGRLGLGLFVGASAAYSWGDGDDGFGFVPEAGAALGPLEIVFDINVTGDAKWWAIRGDFAF